MMSKTFSLNDLLGLTIYASQPVPIKTEPTDSAPVVRTVPAGQPVGVLYTWLLPKEGREQLYFWYKDSSGQDYYSPYEEKMYSADAINKQIELQKSKEKKPWYENLFQGPQLAQTGLLVVGALVLYNSLRR